MNVDRFAELWNSGKPPGQQRLEWFRFLRFTADFWQQNEINLPVVVEIGIRRGGQKRFWSAMGATHIGLDISNRYAEPDILGDSHLSLTFARLQSLLKTIAPSGTCDLLFIDGDHSYRGVEHDFFKYRSLCSGLVAIHDIHCLRADVQVSDFWRELRANAAKQNLNETFIEFFHPQLPHNYGIGVVIQ